MVARPGPSTARAVLPRRVRALVEDPVEFICRLKIRDKAGKVRSLRPNDEQIEIIRAFLDGDEDILVVKARQIGSSTIVSALLFWTWLTSTDPITIIVLSHKRESARQLFRMWAVFYDHLPAAIKAWRPLVERNKTTMKLATGATVIVDTARGDGGLRSYTCSYLHVSEFAFANDPEELKATAFSAVNEGRVIVESTANYFGDALHQEILRTERGEAEWKYLFFPWYAHRAYQRDIPSDFERTEEEEALVEKFDVTDEQLMWRRRKIAKLGSHKFRREYPADINDAYAQGDAAFYNETDLQYVQPISIAPTGLTVLANPEPDDAYALGADVASGAGQDYSTFHILSKKTGQPVAVFRSNTIPPPKFAEQIVLAATRFNKALVLVESNNGWGSIVLGEIRKLGYTRLWLTPEGKDWVTTTKTRPVIFDTARKQISEGALYQLDTVTLGELKALQVNNVGEVDIPENLPGGGHGDLTISIGLSCICLEHVRLNVQHLPGWIQKQRAQKKLAGLTGSDRARY